MAQDNRDYGCNGVREEGIPLQQRNGIVAMTEDERLDNFFAMVDRDRDGRVSLAELSVALQAGRHGLSHAAVRRLMRAADRDRSGFLDITEFRALVQRPELRQLLEERLEDHLSAIIPPRTPRASQRAAAARSSPLRRQDAIDIYYEPYEYSCWPPPLVMLLLSLLQVGVFAWAGAVATLAYDPRRRHELWRFLTYMFVHTSWMHLLVNLAVQLMLGLFLEMVHCWWRVLLVYGAGVAAGSLGSSLMEPTAGLAGASGGVYALLTAHVATIILNWPQMDNAKGQLLTIMLLMEVDASMVLHNRYVLNIRNSTSHVSHIAGALAGLLVGIGVLRNLEVESWEKKLWWVAVLVYLSLMTIALVLHVFWADHFPALVLENE